jgi:2-oxo-4-hydroxy-4-carboxy-5-ureidoimidazoline decarboxylase
MWRGRPARVYCFSERSTWASRPCHVVQTTPLNHLNIGTREAFVHICGCFFEHSRWIAERTWNHRPFTELDSLHAALCQTVRDASPDEKLKLIASHPDLVGRLAREGKVTRESSTEQAAAGLNVLSDSEIQQFEQYNAAYREKFGFPFVICARENKKDAILKAFPARLANSREQEIETALREILKIARLRLLDAVSET